MHALPRPAVADAIGQLIELPVPADDEHVVVGDGAEGLVHQALRLGAPRITQRVTRMQIHASSQPRMMGATPKMRKPKRRFVQNQSLANLS